MGQKLWGITSGSEAMPNWLTDKQKKNTYATKAGWVLRHASGIEETLVAVSRLSTRLGAASPAKVRWLSTDMWTGQQNREVGIEFNEPVFLDGNCTIVLTGGSSIDGATITNAGSGYSNNPTVTISGDGYGAQVTVSIVNGVIDDFNIVNAGSGYTTISATITDETGVDGALDISLGARVTVTATSNRVQGDLANEVVFRFTNPNNMGDNLYVLEQSITSGAIYETATEQDATLLLSGDVLPDPIVVVYD